MTVEEQVWSDLVSRKHYTTARRISRKLKIPYSSVKNILWQYNKRQVLDVIVLNNENFYRIKE